MSVAAGWYGKLPALGDFASRRLDAAFVQAWDGWLAAGLAELRTRENWLDAYLASPSWRFALLPGALDGSAWVGVLMPSVDRVGRYYPFTLAHALAPESFDAGAWEWLARLDDAAAQALQDDWSVERLEAELHALGVPQAGADAHPAFDDAAALDDLGAVADAARFVAAEARALWLRAMRERALWHAVPQDGAPRLLRSRGLGGTALVAALFGGCA